MNNIEFSLGFADAQNFRIDGKVVDMDKNMEEEIARIGLTVENLAVDSAWKREKITTDERNLTSFHKCIDRLSSKMTLSDEEIGKMFNEGKGIFNLNLNKKFGADKKVEFWTRYGVRQLESFTESFSFGKRDAYGHKAQMFLSNEKAAISATKLAANETPEPDELISGIVKGMAELKAAMPLMSQVYPMAELQAIEDQRELMGSLLKSIEVGDIKPEELKLKNEFIIKIGTDKRAVISLLLITSFVLSACVGDVSAGGSGEKTVTPTVISEKTTMPESTIAPTPVLSVTPTYVPTFTPEATLVPEMTENEKKVVEMFDYLGGYKETYHIVESGDQIIVDDAQNEIFSNGFELGYVIENIDENKLDQKDLKPINNLMMPPPGLGKYYADLNTDFGVEMNSLEPGKELIGAPIMLRNFGDGKYGWGFIMCEKGGNVEENYGRYLVYRTKEGKLAKILIKPLNQKQIALFYANKNK